MFIYSYSKKRKESVSSLKLVKLFIGSRFVATLILLIFATNSMNSQVLKPYYRSFTETVVDTLKAQEIAQEIKSLMQKELDSLNKEEYYIIQLDSVGYKKRNKVSNEAKQYWKNYDSQYQQSHSISSSSTYSHGNIVTGIAGLMRQSAMSSNISKSAFASLPKRLIEVKNRKEYLNQQLQEDFLTLLTNFVSEMRNVIERKVVNRNEVFKNDKASKEIYSELEKYYQNNQIQIPKREILIQRDIVNFGIRKEYIVRKKTLELDQLDTTLIYGNWNWVKSDDYSNINVNYPERLSYKKYASYPNYRVNHEDEVYDSKGNLVAIAKISRNDIPESEIMNTLCITDYLNNKYDIKKENKDVHYAIRNILKLDNDVNKKLSSAMLQSSAGAFADELKYSNNIVKKQRQSQRDLKLANSVLPSVAKLFNSTAQDYIDQLKSDHINEIKNIYLIRRIDNTSFKVVFCDDEANLTIAVVVRYKNSERYKSYAEYEIVNLDYME